MKLIALVVACLVALISWVRWKRRQHRFVSPEWLTDSDHRVWAEGNPEQVAWTWPVKRD